MYHWPPLGSPTCWTGTRHYGDADVAAWIAHYRPDFVLAGHVHEPPFKQTAGDAVFNKARLIDTVGNRATQDARPVKEQTAVAVV